MRLRKKTLGDHKSQYRGGIAQKGGFGQFIGWWEPEKQ